MSSIGVSHFFLGVQNHCLYSQQSAWLLLNALRGIGFVFLAKHQGKVCAEDETSRQAIRRQNSASATACSVSAKRKLCCPSDGPACGRRVTKSASWRQPIMTPRDAALPRSSSCPPCSSCCCRPLYLRRGESPWPRSRRSLATPSPHPPAALKRNQGTGIED